MLRASCVLLTLLWLTPGCGSGQRTPVDAGAGVGDAAPCGVDYLGNPQASPQFVPTALGQAMASEVLLEGGTVSLIAPPQGGRVAFVGVKGVTNFDPCGATLLAAVRDPISRQVRLDSRTVNLALGSDGRGESIDSDISTFANVPLCPNQWARDALYNRDYEFTVTLTDRQNRSITQSLTLRPVCNIPGEETVCRCLCKKDYMLGESCTEDGQDGGT